MNNNSNIPKNLPPHIDPKIDLLKVKRDCNKLVKSRARVSAGVAIIPVPFLDIVVDAGLLTILLPEITAKFGLIDSASDLDKLASNDERAKDIKSRIFQFAGLIATRGMVKKTIQGFGGRVLTKQITKYVPFGGQIVAASLGYIIFKKVANDHIDECFHLANKIQKQSV